MNTPTVNARSVNPPSVNARSVIGSSVRAATPSLLVAAVFLVTAELLRAASPLLDLAAGGIGVIGAAGLAMVIFVAPALIGVAVAAAGTTRAMLGAVAAVVALRLAAQLQDPPSLLVVGTGAAAGIGGLVLTVRHAAVTRSAVAATTGVLLGMVADLTIRAAYATWDPIFRPGVLPWLVTLVVGAVAVAGTALLEAEAVRAVSFTGSARVGARVAEVCARRNIRYQTEMGGKNVVIVASDADLDRAVDLTVAGAMRYAGQKCTATSRAVVVKEVADAFVRRVREGVEALAVGPVTDPATAVGPLITEAARERVRSAVDAADAERVCGGTVPSDDRLGGGFFYTPTVLRDVDPGSDIARDELFGPVLATLEADDMDEAIALANRTRYGLSASLFTRDLGVALDYVRRIEVGLVRVNGDTTGVDPHAPFGGSKGSSSGSREQGPAAREFYTEIRTVQIHP